MKGADRAGGDSNASTTTSTDATPSRASLTAHTSAGRLLEAALLIRGATATDADALAFMGRILVQATLPHSDPGDVVGYGRSNGRLSLTIQPGVYTDSKGVTRSLGVPYGALPRLVLAWLTTEAVKTGSPRVRLGETLTDFMRDLGIVPTGGRWGTTARLRDQMKRLFSARITATLHHEDEPVFLFESADVATHAELWWDPQRPDQAALFESVVVLGDRFFKAITERPVPVDYRALKALRKSPLGLDLYTWLTYRVSYLTDVQAVPWSALHRQFGTDYAEVKDFTKKAKRELKKIALLWPELRYETPRGRLVLKPSPTHVPPAPDAPALPASNGSEGA